MLTAAAVVVLSAGRARALGLTPLARFVAYATAGVEPERFGIGPVPAIRKALRMAGLTLDQIDLVELNEAFAAQVLACLRELPIDTVKLDSSFIRELGRRREDSKIVGAVIQLAHGLGMEVVAEGVEEEEQMVILEMLYCDKMQGFLFSRPLEAQAFESLMDASVPFRTGQAPSRAPAAR